jgi:hypothetical protein
MQTYVSHRLETSQGQNEQEHKLHAESCTRQKTKGLDTICPSSDLLTVPTMMLSSSRIAATVVGRSQTQTNRLFSLQASKAATSMALSSSRVASAALVRSRVLARRWLSESKTGATETVAKDTAAPAAKEAAKESKGYWHSAEFWGTLGALAGWGMYVLLFACYVHLNYLLYIAIAVFLQVRRVPTSHRFDLLTISSENLLPLLLLQVWRRDIRRDLGRTGDNQFNDDARPHCVFVSLCSLGFHSQTAKLASC